jgi:hypothetical protein
MPALYHHYAQAEDNPLLVPSKQNYLTEYDLIRETLFMLQGVNAYIYLFDPSGVIAVCQLNARMTYFRLWKTSN